MAPSKLYIVNALEKKNVPVHNQIIDGVVWILWCLFYKNNRCNNCIDSALPAFLLGSRCKPGI
ncbi:hypothetical protein CIK89_04755 [Prevotella sp. P4-119]|nr:hypothetical protein CIK89_04755 [Prevotella sp. P4-119]